MEYFVNALWGRCDLSHDTSPYGIEEEFLLEPLTQLGRVDFGGRISHALGHIGLCQTVFLSIMILPLGHCLVRPGHVSQAIVCLSQTLHGDLTY